MITNSLLKRVYKKRKEWSYKYDFGSLLVIGGSKLYHGAPRFEALSALRSGCDLVTIIAPERAANIIARSSPDLITYPLKGDFLKKSHLRDLLKFTRGKTAVVIGGGLGRERETLSTVNEFLKKTKLPCVVDADAIHAIAKNKNIIKKTFVITPHSQEFFVLSGIRPSIRSEKRKEAVKKVARKLNCTILLKGFFDVISNGKKVALNKTGSPKLTVGGTGDTLAGIAGALLARGTDTFTAACAAAYINGLAGELAAKKFGESMIASDVLEEIYKVLTKV